MGIFQFEEEFIDALRKLKESGFDTMTAMSPIPLREADHILGLGKSPVRHFTLAGAITGAVGGFAMTVLTALTFILPTSGRPIITIPSYLVISYEMTILLGVLFTLLGFHVVSGLPAWRDKIYHPSANVDRFSLVVECADREKTELAEEIIRDSGAEEVSQVEGEL
jgi:molybdopterin-containing oxidoreductase family membrane subunit